MRVVGKGLFEDGCRGVYPAHGNLRFSCSRVFKLKRGRGGASEFKLCSTLSYNTLKVNDSRKKKKKAPLPFSKGMHSTGHPLNQRHVTPGMPAGAPEVTKRKFSARGSGVG
ncbi:hypothetical protein CEXT_261361 [Caerostris extrusa]|uniref:Uncharacterized protein n=1 Tax=Caerostris extrusa TaxID=172846 RepID=A0AAV4U0G5_CAEEX|nr:hypothetical protein CEXT_261361 [Caerostris extrusa]